MHLAPYVFIFFLAGCWESPSVIGTLPDAVVKSNDCPGAITLVPPTPLVVVTT